jgi:hypothetical protein
VVVCVYAGHAAGGQYEEVASRLPPSGVAEAQVPGRPRAGLAPMEHRETIVDSTAGPRERPAAEHLPARSGGGSSAMACDPASCGWLRVRDLCIASAVLAWMRSCRVFRCAHPLDDNDAWRQFLRAPLATPVDLSADARLAWFRSVSRKAPGASGLRLR